MSKQTEAEKANAVTEQAAPVKATKSSNVVTMQDGRTVDFGLRNKRKSETTITGEGQTRKAEIRIDVVNGATHNLTIDLAHPLSLLLELAVHGAVQKIGDSSAKSSDPDDIDASVMSAIADIKAGNFNTRNPSTGIKGIADLVEAVRRSKGAPDTDEARTKVKDWVLGQQVKDPKYIEQKLRKNLLVKEHLANIAQEKVLAAKAKAEADGTEAEDLFAGLEAG